MDILKSSLGGNHGGNYLFLALTKQSKSFPSAQQLSGFCLISSLTIEINFAENGRI
jgi:hypothetical protein